MTVGKRAEPHEESDVLFELVDDVEEVLVPVEPPSAFQERLRRDLLASMQLREAQPTIEWQRGPSREALGIAVLGSAMSLAGLIAFLRSRRGAKESPDSSN
jgi:hypothetical protein